MQHHEFPGSNSALTAENKEYKRGGEVGKVAESTTCISVTIPVTLEESASPLVPHTILQQGPESICRDVSEASSWGGGGRSIHHVTLSACSKERASESWAGS